MGVKLAKAMGAQVTVLTSSPDKAAAARSAGADDVVSMSDASAVWGLERTFDLIISTIPRTHDVTPYLAALKVAGSYVIVGAIEPMLEPYDASDLIGRRASIAGSGIGGIAETQEMLDFCAERGIVSNIEVVKIDEINDVHDRVSAGKASHRFVIDIETIKNAG